MRLTDPTLPTSAEPRLVQALSWILRGITNKVNDMAAGQLQAWDGLAIAAPTAGTWGQGDTLRNSAPVVAGAGGSQYVVIGWICVAGGTPGTWAPMRTLTGT